MVKIAIIGGGISGISAAEYLHTNNIDFTLFEKNDYLGGHAGSYPICNEQEHTEYIPTGMSVITNEYINLLAFLEKYNIPLTGPFYPTAHIEDINHDYVIDIHSEQSVFTKIKKVIKEKGFRTFIFDALRLYYCASKYKKSIQAGKKEISFNEFLINNHFKELTISFYKNLIGWNLVSLSSQVILDAPASAIIEIMEQHRILTPIYKINYSSIYGYKQGAIDTYKRITEKFNDNVILNFNVESISIDDNDKIIVKSGNERYSFDKLILATTSGKQAYDLLKDSSISDKQLEVLSNFKHSNSTVVLHHDEKLVSWLAKDKWRIYNSRIEDNVRTGSVYINQLCGIVSHQPYFQTWDVLDNESINFALPSDEDILLKLKFNHPVINHAQFTAVSTGKLDAINGLNNLFYAGTWTNNGEGSHEKGFISGRKAAALALNQTYTPLQPETIPKVHIIISYIMEFISKIGRKKL